MNLTAPPGAASTVRGERGASPALPLEAMLAEVVYGELGDIEESCALRSFSMKGVGPPAPAQKST